MKILSKAGIQHLMNQSKECKALATHYNLQNPLKTMQ
jgi:hypothetical protein